MKRWYLACVLMVAGFEWGGILIWTGHYFVAVALLVFASFANSVQIELIRRERRR